MDGLIRVTGTKLISGIPETQYHAASMIAVGFMLAGIYFLLRDQTPEE